MTELKIKPKKLKGTHEWAQKTVNLQYGCENNCRYCYARKMAARFNRIPEKGWEYPILKLNGAILPRNTNVMFPSTHDITKFNLGETKEMLVKLYERNNHILLVSKPRLECIKAICDTMGQAKNQLEFRFTIGAMNDNLLGFWEPNAPRFLERKQSIDYVLSNGYKVSISCEPLLDEDCDIVEYLLKFYPEIKTIWIGAMNYCKGAPQLNYGQIYLRYKNNPIIQWKDSFRKHLKGEL